jgi:exosortase E/protease (VPEID-CTERM system)
MKGATTKNALLRWGGLVVIALAEVTWLAIRVEMPATGFLSGFKGFPSIFITSLAVVTVLIWARSRGRLLALQIFQDFSHNPLPMVLAHWGAFAVFFWLTIVVSEGDAVSSSWAVYWLLAWAVTGVGAGVFWLLAAMPVRAWVCLVRQNSPLAWAGAIIIAASWVLGFFMNRAWEPLLGPTFQVVEWLLWACGQEVVSQPANLLLGTSQFAVAISPACAGYEGIGLILVFVGSYLWLFRGNLRFPQTFILLPCGIFVIWFANAVRITLLVLFGTYVSPQIALGGFHSATGWLGFIAVAFSMVAVTQQLPFFAARQSEVKMKASESEQTAAYLAPLLALLAIIMVTRVFLSAFDWFYPVRVLGTATAIWTFWRRKISRLHCASVWSGSAIGVGVAVFVVWVGLEWAMGNLKTNPAIPHTLEAMPAGFAAAWLIFRVLGSVLTVPIAEELAFRGYLLRRLISPDFDKLSPRFTWLSFLLSSFLFGVLHGRWLAGAVAGMFYAWATYRRGKVGDAIIAHATTNALIAVDVLMLGNWHYWN